MDTECYTEESVSMTARADGEDITRGPVVRINRISRLIFVACHDRIYLCCPRKQHAVEREQSHFVSVSLVAGEEFQNETHRTK